MDKKNLEGNLDKAKGRIKETVGVVTGDRDLEAEGKLDNLKGKIKDVAGDVREGIKEKLDDLDRPKDDRNP
ncbi:MAG: general stress protein CsbD [Deltaproteobacteria bacterium 13_1_40CM_4_68_19]|nr:MAG: general stress protein CsbD [Deltaproteobacteria bacterium 13_1_40CM_4_68_19]OLD10039.1 MAG: general stress protein CsbD [Deltaproteobacteria bacterium 13_1_40CM_3_69_14]OLD32890.1 MAG: general stress protein CsbD [Myxococcales bacterium 13_1_40CM_2_68_15]